MKIVLHITDIQDKKHKLFAKNNNLVLLRKKKLNICTPLTTHMDKHKAQKKDFDKTLQRKKKSMNRKFTKKNQKYVFSNMGIQWTPKEKSKDKSEINFLAN